MFTSVLDLKANECGEYEVAKGVSAPMFRAILVSYHHQGFEWLHKSAFVNKHMYTNAR